VPNSRRDHNDIAGLYDKAGKLVAEWISKPEDLTSMPVKAAMLAPAGAYRLRTAAGDAAGHIGVVDAQIVVELMPAGSLKLSSIVLGVPGATGGFSPRRAPRSGSS